MSFANTVLEGHDSLLVDLDGVVYVGHQAVPGAADALASATSRGRRVVFVTNNASREPGDVAAQLQELGVSAQADDVLTSAQAGAALIARQIAAGSAVLAVGGPGVAAALRDQGFAVVDALTDPPPTGGDDVAGVVQGFGRDLTWRALARASFAVATGVPWVATNIDQTIPVPGGIAPGNGALVDAVAAATGRRPEVAGKPYPPLLLRAAQVAGGLQPLVVGDRLDTDIEGAANAKMSSLLVLSGVTTAIDLWRAPFPQRPDYIAADLRGLHEPVITVSPDGAGFRCGDARAQVTGTRITLTDFDEDPVGAVWAGAQAMWAADAEPDNAIDVAAQLDQRLAAGS